ncbi:MAG: carboxypeptidase-like regulatory domain-containing protein [Anaerolineales bacterium]|jgi:hypothetical protein
MLRKTALPFICLVTMLLATACVTVPFVPDDPAKGYKINGFIGKSAQEAASGELVTLVDANTGQTIDQESSNFFGKYSFSQLPPGNYQIRVGRISRNVVLRNRSIRLDIDLSAPGGRMDYTKDAVTKLSKTLTAESKPSSTGSAGSGGITGPVTRDASGWPPPYEKPTGRVSPDDSSPKNLLYKFAGRWDHVSSNTLHNIYLKPDGSFEDSYEAGYSGQFVDQGGLQTGNWGAANNEQAGGRWTIQGTLRQGTITLIHRNGKRTNYRYQVHCRGSECYGGEYFFNGKLYSVKYIYR